jgi:hypothetical protein
MQINFSQSVSQIAPAAGPGREQSHRQGHSAAATGLQRERSLTEIRAQTFNDDHISAVRQARNAIAAGTLETDAAFTAVAETLLTIGI